MAKDGTNSQKKYIIEWTGENTGYLYKLAVIPSYNDSNYASLTDTDEPYQCLNDYEFTPFEYDKYPIGLGAAPKLKLDIDLTLCSADFAKVLCDPFVTFDRVTTFNTDSIFPCHETFTTGNIFELYIDFGFGAGFQQIYVGTQITSIEEYDNQKNILSIETESIFKTITGQVRFDNFLFLHCFYTQNGSSQAVPKSFIKTKYYFDKLSAITTSVTLMSGRYSQAVGGYNMYFSTYDNFNAGMEDLCSVLWRKIYRESSYGSFLIENVNAKYYKQDNEATGDRDDLLSTSDLRVLAHIAEDDLVTTGTFSETGSNDGIVYGLGGEYDSLWDFLNDWYGSYLQKGMIGYLSNHNYLNVISKGVATTTETTTDNKDLFDIKITFFSDVSSKFTISSLEESTWESDSVEVNVLGSRSSEAIEFVQPIHTVSWMNGGSTQSPFQQVPSVFFPILTGSAKIANCALFYYGKIEDSSSTLLYSGISGDYIITVHHNPQITVSYDNDTDTDLYSDDYNDAPIGIYDNVGINAKEWKGDTGGSYYVSAKTMSYFFSNPNQTKIEFSTFLNNGVIESIGDTGLSPVIMPFFYWNIDLTDFEPQTGVFSNLPTKYEMIKCTVKKDEMAELTLLSRTE
jgi:hypothetical protein